MHTAGTLGLKKKKHEDCDVFFVRTGYSFFAPKSAELAVEDEELC